MAVGGGSRSISCDSRAGAIGGREKGRGRFRERERERMRASGEPGPANWSPSSSEQ